MISRVQSSLLAAEQKPKKKKKKKGRQDGKIDIPEAIHRRRFIQELMSESGDTEGWCLKFSISYAEQLVPRLS